MQYIKQLFLFDSYGFTGGKAFIIQDDRKIKRDVNCYIQLIEMFF